jgi:hypothetical protein
LPFYVARLPCHAEPRTGTNGHGLPLPHSVKHGGKPHSVKHGGKPHSVKHGGKIGLVENKMEKTVVENKTPGGK